MLVRLLGDQINVLVHGHAKTLKLSWFLLVSWRQLSNCRSIGHLALINFVSKTLNVCFPLYFLLLQSFYLSLLSFDVLWRFYFLFMGSAFVMMVLSRFGLVLWLLLIVQMIKLLKYLYLGSNLIILHLASHLLLNLIFASIKLPWSLAISLTLLTNARLEGQLFSFLFISFLDYTFSFS